MGQRGGEIEVQRITVIELGVDKRSGDVCSSLKIERVSDTPKITKVVVARSTYSRDLILKRQSAIEDDAEVASGVNRVRFR
jgi:hypothetical protein